VRRKPGVDGGGTTDTRAAVCTAIAERRFLLFTYYDRERVAYPCAHGFLSTGNEALRAHEATLRDGRLRVGAGKLFLLASMSNVRVAEQNFDDPPHGYRRDDRGMASVHCQL
jgi:hypothetical protein